jgi:cell division protein FtsB
MKQILYRPVVVFVITICAAYFIFSLKNNLKRVDLSQQNLATIQAEVDELDQSVTQQKEELAIAEQPLAKEKITRNELLMQKEGEIVIRLPEIEIPEPVAVKADVATPWEEWQELLF